MPSSNNLRAVRQQASVTIEVLAVQAAVSPTVIGMTERANYWPTAATQLKIATALGVDVQTIWPGDRTPAIAA